MSASALAWTDLLLAPVPSALSALLVLLLVGLVITREVLRLHRDAGDELIYSVSTAVRGLTPPVVVLLVARVVLIML